MTELEQPRKIAGWPVQDLAVLATATVAAGGVLYVASHGDLLTTLAGAAVGLVWFFAGILYGVDV